VFLDLRDAMDVNREKLRKDVHSVLPLCEGGLDHVVGFIRSTTLLDRMLGGHAFELRALAEPPLFVPETMTLMRLLEQFKRTRLPVALVVDEFGGVEGLVSLTAAGLGEVPKPTASRSRSVSSSIRTSQLGAGGGRSVVPTVPCRYTTCSRVVSAVWNSDCRPKRPIAASTSGRLHGDSSRRHARVVH
jgi:hypothetical protein